jgi:hypothetical protein
VVPLFVENPLEAYNLDELVALISTQLPAARTVLLRRLVRDYHRDQYWQELKRSFKSGGKFVLRAGVDSAVKGVRAVSDILNKPGK